MKVVGCTFATRAYEGSAAVLRHTALREGGMDEFVVFDETHPDLVDESWKSWCKAWCIRRALETCCQPGDVVVYCDAAQSFLSSVRPYVDATRHVLLFRHGDASPEALDATTPQLSAAMQLWRHTPQALEFLTEYERRCGDVTPPPGGAQAVLTELAAEHPAVVVVVAKDASLVDHYRAPVNPVKVAVITPTVGSRFLAGCVASVQAQTLPNVVHYVVVDGPQHEARVREALAPHARRHPIVTLTLPHNVGAGGWNGHRVYGALPWLVPEDVAFVAFLDEDNELEPDHFRWLVREVVARDVPWGHSLRTIIDQDGAVVCADNCESLGAIAPTVCASADRLVDTSCYLLDRPLAIAMSTHWNRKARNDDVEVDRSLTQALLRVPHACSRRHSVRYRVASRADSVQASFFVEGNARRGHDFAARPDLYVFHFAADVTARALEAVRDRGRSCVLDAWQPSQLKGLAARFNLLNGYECMDCVPQGAAVLVTMCVPQTIPWEFLKGRPDLRRVLYTIESPNIRHAAQWDPHLLDQHFDVFLTYWAPLLRHPKAVPCFHNTAFLDLDDPVDAAQLRDNRGAGTSCAMVLERRGLAGTYAVPNVADVTLTCLEPWREALVLAAAAARGGDVTVYGVGWAEFVAQHPHVRLGHSRSRHHDPQTAVDILQNHTFNLIAENCDAEGYVSEKLYHALMAGCIPLYYGNTPPPLVDIPEGPERGVYLDLRAMLGADPTDAAALAKLTAFLDGLDPQTLEAWRERVVQKRRDILRAVGCHAFADLVERAVARPVVAA